MYIRAGISISTLKYSDETEELQRWISERLTTYTYHMYSPSYTQLPQNDMLHGHGRALCISKEHLKFDIHDKVLHNSTRIMDNLWVDNAPRHIKFLCMRVFRSPLLSDREEFTDPRYYTT